MPTFRLTVRRTVISHEVIEVQAGAALEATQKGTRYVDGVRGARRGVEIVQTHDEDANSTELLEVVAVRER